MVPAFQQCESHPGRSLTAHLLDVADRLSEDAVNSTWLKLVGVFHDLGKATSFFQSHLHGGKPPEDLRRHSELGALWLLNVLHKGDNGFSPVKKALGFLFVLRHHGRLWDILDELIIDSSATTRVCRQLAEMDIRGIRRWFDNNLAVDAAPPPLDQRALTELRVTLKLSLNATRCDVDAMARFQSALRAFGLLIESDHDSAAGFKAGYFHPPHLTLNHIEAFRIRKGFGSAGDSTLGAARDLVYQSAVSRASEGDVKAAHQWTLSVPTGAAKTLAALGWALTRREARIRAGMPDCPIIYALPFTSIIDQNVLVLQTLWDKTPVDESMLCVHHHLAEPGELAKSGEESLARSWIEGWRADVVCTTFVQVVNALFHGTSADARRLSRLAGSILVLDEVQAFPAELWPILRTSLESLSRSFGTDILLVTATQPALFDEANSSEIGPVAFPDELQQAFDRYDVSIDIANTIGLSDLRQRIAGALTTENRNSCLVILNTVKEALELHKALAAASEFAGYRLFHLSTNLRPKDRRIILAEIHSCNVPHVVVATQVVEAGVDLSFDLVFRALAPLDAIVQAGGRCNRHGTGPRGLVCIIDMVGNRGVIIYGETHMALAREVLVNATAVVGSMTLREPELRQFVTQYFHELSSRLSQDCDKEVMEAVRMLQFAALRGEGQDRRRDAKRIQLIEDQFDRIPHFIETDNSDTHVWAELKSAFGISESSLRRQRLRALRNEVGQCVVEVPMRDALKDEPDTMTHLVHVPLRSSSEHYDVETGWRHRS